MFVKSPQVLYKFGKTLSSDILERFSVEYHNRLNWRGVPLGQDYNIKPIWSRWVTKERAIKAEDWFKRTYTKEFFCSRPYNGITECRNWTVKQHQEFTEFLYKNYPATEEYEAEIRRLKRQGTITQTHSKIYYIMLTKKQ
jgi:hypothetical protein